MRSSRAFPFANGRKIRWIRPCSEILWALGLRGCDAGHGRFIPSEALGWHFVPNPALGTKTDPVLVMLGVPRLCSSAGAEWHGRLHTQHDGFDAIICTSSKYGRKARSRGSTFFFSRTLPGEFARAKIRRGHPDTGHAQQGRYRHAGGSGEQQSKIGDLAQPELARQR